MVAENDAEVEDSNEHPECLISYPTTSSEKNFLALRTDHSTGRVIQPVRGRKWHEPFPPSTNSTQQSNQLVFKSDL